jgi:hypothetical protein
MQYAMRHKDFRGQNAYNISTKSYIEKFVEQAGAISAPPSKCGETNWGPTEVVQLLHQSVLPTSVGPYHV